MTMTASALHVEDHEGVLVATLHGEIDIANAGEIRDELFSVMSNRTPAIVVDLSGVSYLDSRGVHLLLELSERSQIRDQKLRLVLPDRSPIRRILEITHLDAVVPLDATLADATAQLRGTR
jgi:anti-anti-sigma factor